MGRHPLTGSERTPFDGARSVGKADPAERLEVSVLIRSFSSNALRERVNKLAAGDASQGPLKREDFAKHFGADSTDIAAVKTFADHHGLAVVEDRAARRTLVLSGTVAQFNDAFGVDLQQFEHAGGSYRGLTGPVHLPDELAGVVEAVLGLDNRPQARPHFRIRTPHGNVQWRASPMATTSFTPTQVASLYDFPIGTGQGECIALIELGGGYRPADLKAYFAELGITVPPKVSAVSVDHGKNHPTGEANGPDGEVMLDIEVAGAIAPGAQIAVYFAPNTDAGFLDAVTTAIHDTTNKPSVISISWGGPESSWSQQAMTEFDQAFQAAAAMGITVCVASGDNGSSDGVDDGADHVNFPASSPYALACGGTSVQAANGIIESETVWNDGASGGAGGGGVSRFFALPAWQQGQHVTRAQGVSSALPMRGVPDVSGNADPATGYDVRVDGNDMVMGGTSAVAPLWAGLIARINAAKGSPAGYLNPRLYKSETALNNITNGNNGDFLASAGWNACTGLGSPDGQRIAEVIAGWDANTGRGSSDGQNRVTAPLAEDTRGEPAEQASQGVEKRINAWVSERIAEPTRPLELGERYTLNLGVGTWVPASLIGEETSTIPTTDLIGGGLQTEWVISTSAFELASDDSNVALTTTPVAAPNLWEARFSLWIPEEGESDVRRLFIVPRVPQICRLDVLIFAVRNSSSELYREFSVEVPVDRARTPSSETAGTVIRDELVYAPGAHMNLKTTHEWTTHPGRLDLAVLPGMLHAYVKGDLPGGRQVDEHVDWHAQQANLAGPITNVRDAAEKFRGKWEQYLNDIDAQDLLQRLARFAPTYDWTHRHSRADSRHTDNWDKASKSPELRDLVIYGHELYETVFRPAAELRMWMDSLSPGYRVDIFWTESSGAGYVPNVPWGLMYLPDPPARGEAVDPLGFLALRFRIGYRGYRGVSAGSKALGAMANAHQAYCLYWGDHPDDDVGHEAVWQRQQFQGWQNPFFVPQVPGSPTACTEVIQALSTPQRSPTTVIYLFCHAAVGAGNKPVLRFGATSGPADVLQTTDLLGAKPLCDQPLVFANACTTSAADPYIANLLEQNLFRRGCRGFLGTETKVPIQLASRFATVFFNFFYRKVDQMPMAAGEALAQTRLFLLTEYANIGGIFYAYLNQYELYMANDAEVLALRA